MAADGGFVYSQSTGGAAMTQLLGRQESSANWAKRLRAWLVLLVMGITWGLSFSLARIAATGGAHPLGITFWESSISGIILIGVVVLRRIPVPLSKRLIRLHLATGIVGMVIPGVAFFYAASHVPAGILSITVSAVPILTFVASAFFGLEKFALGRVTGVVLGMFAIMLLVGPQGSLPDPAQLPWVLLALAAPLGYATLNMVLTLMAPPGASPFILTSGMFVAASLILVPVIAMTGSFVPMGWPWTAIEWSLFGLGVINAIAYVLYFYLVDRAGPVFGSLTANFVTLFGVIWGVVLFGERNSVWVWLSLVTMMAALILVAPRERAPATQSAVPD